MLLGVDEELGSARELALIFMKNRENKIRSLETFLISKALFISGTENIEDKNKQIGEYNKMLSEYQDLTNPTKVADRKKFERSFKDQAKGLKGMNVNDLVGGKKLSLGKKPKENFSKTLSAAKNWGKIN
jgi:hypothetical protein